MFSDNKHIADFLYQFESTPGTCSGGYKIKKFSSSTYTTAYGITNHLLKDYSSYNLLPCSTVSSNNNRMPNKRNTLCSASQYFHKPT